MVLNYLSTDALEEVPTINNFKKLTWYLLFVQFGVTVFYHFGRTGGSGIYYGWIKSDYYYARFECIQLDYDRNNSKWNEYHCDDYFENYLDNDNPFCNKINRNDEEGQWEWHNRDCDSSSYKVAEKCGEIRNQNASGYTSYSNWVNDGCEVRFSSLDVDYYCAWEIYECDDYFSYIATYQHYGVEDFCKYENNRDSGWCGSYFDTFDSPNYICTNHNSSTHKNWTHACNCKDYTSEVYHEVGKTKCANYTNTATYTCHKINTNHQFYDDACSCKDYVLDVSEWYDNDCNIKYINENWLPSYAGISFPWVGGIWFVLAVWTTTLSQEFKACFLYTLISLIVNIAADTVNSFHFRGITTGTLVGFSILIVFPSLTLMKKAFQKLQVSTKEKELVNLQTIALKNMRTIFLIGLAQVYISLPTYQHTFEQSIGEDHEAGERNELALMRHVIPTATGGILNVAYVVSILFVDITKLHFVDFLNGETYNLEFLIGLLQVIGFALALGLSALELPKKEEVVLEFSDTTEEQIYHTLLVSVIQTVLNFKLK